MTVKEAILECAESKRVIKIIKADDGDIYLIPTGHDWERGLSVRVCTSQGNGAQSGAINRLLNQVLDIAAMTPQEFTAREAKVMDEEEKLEKDLESAIAWAISAIECHCSEYHVSYKTEYCPDCQKAMDTLNILGDRLKEMGDRVSALGWVVDMYCPSYYEERSRANKAENALKAAKALACSYCTIGKEVGREQCAITTCPAY